MLPMSSNPSSSSNSSSDSSIITVFEHQRLISHDFVQVSDFAWLIAQEFSVFTLKRQRGQWQLKVGHYVGIILLPSGMVLEILPKPIAQQQSTQQQLKPHNVILRSDISQARQWVQRMLADLTGTRSNKLPHHKKLGQMSDDLNPLPMTATPLLEWLVTQFLQRLSLYQPTRYYQAQVVNQSALQGKLLIKEQIRRNLTQPTKFVCETSQLSQDMLCNRLIKSALLLVESLALTRSRHISNESHQGHKDHQGQGHQLKHGRHEGSDNQGTRLFRALFKSLLPWRQIAALNGYEMQSLDSIYQQAKRQLSIQPLRAQQLQAAEQLLDFSYWLLRQSNTDIGSGLSSQALPKKSSNQLRVSVLIDMNQAFEQWATQCIVTILSETDAEYQPSYQAQRVWLKDEAGKACLSIRPDLLMYRETSGYSHVIDVKWKHLSYSGAISASDAYQLSSYAHAYQAKQVWLVYPVTDDIRQPVALNQHNYRSSSNSNSNDNGNNKSERSTADSYKVKLWLMPFNVLTATFNGWSAHNNSGY